MLPLILGCGISLLLTPLARQLALRTGTLDHPVGLKIHKAATPLMGGVAVFVAFAITAFVFLPLTAPVIGVMSGGAAAVVVGVVDERFTLTPLVHLAGQIAAALIAMGTGIGVIRTLSIPTAGLASPGFALPFGIGFVLTLFWLVLMMNTVNFLDGMDGLSSGVVIVAALLLVRWASEPQRFFLQQTLHHEDLILPAILAGAVLGFLPYNWHPARIFLGDSGPMFLGLALGAMSIIGAIKLATALLVLLIPILDVVWAIIRRRLRGRNFLSGDKQHVYHRMLELGLSHTTIVLSLYAVVVALAVIDLQLLKLAKLVAFVLLTLTIGSAFVLLELKANQKSAALAGSSPIPAEDLSAIPDNRMVNAPEDR